MRFIPGAHVAVVCEAARVLFGEAFQGPATVFAEKSVSQNASFSVHMPVKASRTAIGWCSATECDKYLTPDYRSSAHPHYVSIGGAGYIYPSKNRASKGYGEGDTVRTEIDFANNLVRFWVNGDHVGETPWNGGDVAYAAISSQGNRVDCHISS
mmetsp:Transcript_40375/g.59447  ORF Transcript_40375/g.59447 Transcript_40375/m.59447 type:complete len:154 (+) Transcript_40375:140-601(+)